MKIAGRNRRDSGYFIIYFGNKMVTFWLKGGKVYEITKIDLDEYDREAAEALE